MSRYEIHYTSDDGIERVHKGTQSGKGRKYHDEEKLKVFYSIQDPENIRITYGIRSGRKVVKIGIIMVLFNLLSVFSDRKRTRIENKFKATGRKVAALILKIEKDTTLNIKGTNPYLIDCDFNAVS